jgi:hypothetical protein
MLLTATPNDFEDQIWLVSFLDFDLGFFDREEGRVEPAPNPFVPEKVSAVWRVQAVESKGVHVGALAASGAPVARRTCRCKAVQRRSSRLPVA